MLLCVEAVLLSHNSVDQVVSYQIFTILCTVSGLTTNNSVAEKVRMSDILIYSLSNLFLNLNEETDTIENALKWLLTQFYFCLLFILFIDIQMRSSNNIIYSFCNG